jgi:hypothetical protein
MKQRHVFIVFVLLLTVNAVLLFAVDDGNSSGGSNAEDDSFDEDTLIMERVLSSSRL